MKTIIAVLGFALLVMPVHAATDQQEKTKACYAAAAKKELKGDKRKAFVKGCLSAKAKTKPKAAATPKKEGGTPRNSRCSCARHHRSCQAISGFRCNSGGKSAGRKSKFCYREEAA